MHTMYSNLEIAEELVVLFEWREVYSQIAGCGCNTDDDDDDDGNRINKI